MKSFICSLIMCGLAAAMFASCDEKEDEVIINPVPGTSIIHHEPDEEVTIYIHGVDRNLKNARYGIDAPLTVHEILCLDSLFLCSTKIEKDGTPSTLSDYFSYTENNKIDTINNRIAFDDVRIRNFHENLFLNPSFEWNDFIIFRFVYSRDSLGNITSDIDTLAYIPNQQRHDNFQKMLELRENEDWDEIYKLYEEAFTFIPCTGKEYRELKERGEN